MPAKRVDVVIITKKENLPWTGLCYPNGPPRENQKKQKEIQVLRSCQRTKKAV